MIICNRAIVITYRTTIPIYTTLFLRLKLIYFANMAEQNYSSSVRLGNWNEDLFLGEDKLKWFIKKRERGELLVQKSRSLYNKLLREVSIDLPDNCISFGHVIQIIAPECCHQGNLSGIALSGLVTEKEVDNIQHFAEGCLVTGSTLLSPCIRNAFRICRKYILDFGGSSGEELQNGRPLLYGQHFCFCTVDLEPCQPLYVECEVPHIQSILGNSKHPLLRLTNYRNMYCLWKVLPLDWQYREELEGTPVPADTRVVICHVASNKNLAVESHVWFTSFFGMECEVTVHSYFNVYKKETPNNIWMLATKKVPNRLEMVKSCSA